MKLIYHPLFESDLQEITDFIARDSPFHAERLAEKIIAECESIGLRPRLFREQADTRAGLRFGRVGKYAVIYTIDADFVHILRLFHGMRDLSALLRQV